MRKTTAIVLLGAWSASGCQLASVSATTTVAARQATPFQPSAVVTGAVLEAPLSGGLTSRVRIDVVQDAPEGRLVYGHALETAGAAVGILRSDTLLFSVRRPLLGDLDILYQQGREPAVIAPGPQAPFVCLTRSRESALAANDPALTRFARPRGALATGVVDLLVIYTEAARNAAAGCTVCSAVQAAGGAMLLDTRIRTHIAELNAEMLACSGAPIRVHLVATEMVRFAETADLSADLQTWKDSTAGAGTVLAALKQKWQADLVAVIEERTGATVAGVAEPIALTPEYADRAIAVVGRDALYARMTLEHEIGHLMGGGHEDMTNFTGAFSYSHGYLMAFPTTTFSTIMAVENGHDRVPFFSNPKHDLIPGTPAGAADADNVRTMAVLSPFLEDLVTATHAHSPISPTCADFLNLSVALSAMPRQPR